MSLSSMDNDIRSDTIVHVYRNPNIPCFSKLPKFPVFSSRYGCASPVGPGLGIRARWSQARAER